VLNPPVKVFNPRGEKSELRELARRRRSDGGCVSNDYGGHGFGIAGRDVEK